SNSEPLMNHRNRSATMPPAAMIRQSMMKTLFAAMLAMAMLAAATQRARAQEVAATDPTLRLMAGAQKEIRPAQPIERVAVGNPAGAGALLLKQRNGAPSVLVVAKQPGVTDLMIWPKGQAPQTYTVQVDAITPDPGGANIRYSAAGATITGQSPDAYAA